MQVQNLFDTAVRQSIIARINQLSPNSKAQWGKMNVEQMLAHTQLPILFSYGRHTIKGNAIMKLIGPFFKSVLYNEKPYKQSLPTDPTYIVATEKNFEEERSRLLALLNEFQEDNLTGKKHPIFGQLTKDQWGLATWKHLDHHLKQFGV